MGNWKTYRVRCADIDGHAPTETYEIPAPHPGDAVTEASAIYELRNGADADIRIVAGTATPPLA